MTTALHTLIPQLATPTIIVIGDVILDEYLIGNATRMSREAPVPVLELQHRRLIPGGAANPAANIAALNARAIQIGVTGDDPAADHLTDTLRQHQIDTTALIRDPQRPTTVKMRVMAQMGLHFPQQVARIDTLSRVPITAAVAAQVSTAVHDHLPHADALLFSDYRNGLLTPNLVTTIRDMAADRVLLTTDAQGEFSKYHGFGLVKCNAAEASAYLNRPLHTNNDFATAAQTLVERLHLTRGMVITRGADGATLAQTGGTITHCPAPSVSDVYDTVGAGDTAIAVITLALTAGATLTEAVMLANYASGLVVRKVGNYTPSPDELQWALTNWTHNA